MSQPGFLKVLLIDESTARSQSVCEILQSIDCKVIATLTPDLDLLAKVEHYQPDIIIIDIDLPDRDTLENLRTVQTTIPRPMIMFSQDDNGAMIKRAVKAGVSAYVVDGLQENRVRPILDAAIAIFDQFHQLKSQLDESRLELEQRKTIERAKGILMKQRSISEAEAYQLMRKTAMNQKRKIIDIAETLISAAELLGNIES